MCRVHTDEELANILETLADLFAWKRRKTLSEAAVAARFPSQPWRHPSLPDASGKAAVIGLAWPGGSSGTRPA